MIHEVEHLATLFAYLSGSATVAVIVFGWLAVGRETRAERRHARAVRKARRS